LYHTYTEDFKRSHFVELFISYLIFVLLFYFYVFNPWKIALIDILYSKVPFFHYLFYLAFIILPFSKISAIKRYRFLKLNLIIYNQTLSSLQKERAIKNLQIKEEFYFFILQKRSSYETAILASAINENYYLQNLILPENEMNIILNQTRTLLFKIQNDRTLNENEIDILNQFFFSNPYPYQLKLIKSYLK
jgi:hypothetical protein